jgi:hypothetical protein
MRNRLLAALRFWSVSMAGSAGADTYVNGYVRKDGTYVQPHYRTDPDSTKLNNYSTQGNVNPYTGQAGTVDPYATNNSLGTNNNLSATGAASDGGNRGQNRRMSMTTRPRIARNGVQCWRRNGAGTTAAARSRSRRPSLGEGPERRHVRLR